MRIKTESDGFKREIDIYSDEGYKLLAELWTKSACQHRIMYEPTWLGIPIIQFPGDIVMMQELIWKVRPDVIIETGIAHGGSAIFYASILELIGKGKVIGIDVEIRQYNKVAIKSHPLSKRIVTIQGSSIDKDIVKKASGMIKDAQRILVTLDSNHSYDHVLTEMEQYSPLVSKDSYLVVMDGAQELVWDIPDGKKQWQQDNPLRAIKDFLKNHPEWEIDPYYNRLLVTSNPCGFLRRVNTD